MPLVRKENQRYVKAIACIAMLTLAKHLVIQDPSTAFGMTNVLHDIAAK